MTMNSGKDCINFTMPHRELEMQKRNGELTIVDSFTPLIVMFGPRSCGKTMTLIRLSRYLQSEGYSVQPIASFHPTIDEDYSKMCDNYYSMIKGKDVTVSYIIPPLLVGVNTNEKRICQIVDIPGEFCFESAGNQTLCFGGIMDSVLKLDNRKIWAIMVEPDSTNGRMGVEARMHYVNKIHRLKTKISPRDKVMFIFNKIDETPFVIGSGNIKYGLAMQYIEELYPHIFEPFKNVNPITRCWKPYNFDFIAFQTGDFYEAADGTLGFEEGNDIYPHRLWDFIKKRIKS